jgi:protein TonB
MNFSQRQRDPRRHLVGFATVIAFHALVVYALVTGLAKKVVDVVRAPIETKVIEEVKKPPPPLPEIVVPPPPKLEAPPPPYIPPPEVVLATPPPPVPTIAVAPTPTPPPAPVELAPVAPPVQAPVTAAPTPPAPPPVVVAPPAPPPVSASVACSNYSTVMSDAGFPREATRAGLDKGEALVQFTLGPNGEIKDLKVLRASHPIFARSSMRVVGEYKCQGQGKDVIVTVPFGYKLQ